MRPKYEIGKDQQIEWYLAGRGFGGGELTGVENPLHTAVGRARNMGVWLDPATLAPFCIHTQKAAELEGAERMQYENAHNFALRQESEALRFSAALETWAKADPPPAAPTAHDLEERQRWIADRARQLRADHEARLAARFTSEAAAEYDSAHRAAPLKKTAPKGKTNHV